MENWGCEALKGGEVRFEGGLEFNGVSRIDVVTLEDLVGWARGCFGVAGVEINSLGLCQHSGLWGVRRFTSCQSYSMGHNIQSLSVDYTLLTNHSP